MIYILIIRSELVSTMHPECSLTTDFFQRCRVGMAIRLLTSSSGIRASCKDDHWPRPPGPRSRLGRLKIRFTLSHQSPVQVSYLELGR